MAQRRAGTDVTTPMTTRQLVELFARLRWRLLRGAFRRGGAQRVAIIVGTLAALAFGAGAGLAIALVAQTSDDPSSTLIVAPAMMVGAIVALGIIAGVTQPVDPRILAAEPLSDRQLAIGLLTASAFGPPGLAASLVGVGLYLGALRDPSSIAPAVVAMLAFLATLLLVSRSTVNALGLLANRFPRMSQVLIGVASLVFYGGFQFVPTAFADTDDAQRRAIADVVRLTPPGQLGEAFATAGSSPAASFGHTALGALWLPLLWWVFMASTRRLLVSTRGSDDAATKDPQRLVARLARWACGGGQVGTIAWRSIRTRLRHPRTALETFIGAGVGLSIVLVPSLTRDEVGASAVLVGGAVQLSVLFMAGNSFGSDGIALGSEILCGVEPEVLVAAKARSVLVVASPLAVIGPLIAASVTGEWSYLLAGVLVGVGGLLAGVGGSIVQSVMVPIAIPESDNPLAGGDSGQGLFAALVLAAVVVTLAVVTLPIALALLWALDRESVLLVSLIGTTTIAAGWFVLRASVHLAGRRWRTREPEIYDAIIPAT